MRLGLLGLLSLLAAGCPMPPVERPYAAPTAEALAAHLRGRAGALKSLRAETRVDYMAENGDRLKVTMELLVAAGGKLRLSVEAPIGGGTLAALASDGVQFQLHDARNNRFYAGPASACAVGRLLRIELPPADVVAVLTGGAPLDGEVAGSSWDPKDGGREVLELRTSDGGKERIRLDAREHRWDVVDAVRTDAKGNVLWRVAHEDFTDRGGVRLPTRTTVEEPPLKADAKIRFRDVELNVALKDGVFTLTAPTGLATLPLDCH